MNKEKKSIGEEDMNDDVGEQQDEDMGDEIWVEKEKDNNLVNLNEFYTDCPSLPQFPCMSSSSSSSSPQILVVPISASSASSSSSSTDAHWAVLKSDSEDKKQRKRYHHDDGNGPRAVSPTASMEVQPPPENSTGGDIVCLDVMDNFDCTDLIDFDDNDLWDPSSLFENTDCGDGEEIMISIDEENQQIQEGEDENNGHYLLKENTELSTLFLEWLKQNRDFISVEDIRNIKLKRSTIENASKHLGNSKEGQEKLLKLILEWVELHQLQKKKTNDQTQFASNHSISNHYQDPLLQNPNYVPLDPNSCFSPTTWMPPPPPPPPAPPFAGYVTQATGVLPGGYIYVAPGSSQLWNGNYYLVDSSGHPFACSSQFTPDKGSIAVASQIPQASQGAYQMFDENGERLLIPETSATKEARKNRMARHRRYSLMNHHYSRHRNHHQAQAHNHQNEQKGKDNYLSSQTTPLIYSPPSTAGAHDNAESIVSFEESHQQIQNLKHPQAPNHHQNLPDGQNQGNNTEKKLQLLFQKVLKQSDVCNLGRIVLPKKEAEMYLPELGRTKDGISIAIKDIGTSNVWIMRYRFWPNHKSRMYLLENTGKFVRRNDLQEGDFVVFYSDIRSGKYFIRGVKGHPPGLMPEQCIKPSGLMPEQCIKPSKKTRNSPEGDNSKKTRKSPQGDNSKKTRNSPEGDNSKKTRNSPKGDNNKKTRNSPKGDNSKKTRNSPEGDL